MVRSGIMTSLLLAAALLGGPAADATPEFDPFKLAVGVCPVDAGLRRWTVVWHPAPPDLPEEQALALGRVFKHLEEQDVDACLTLMIESDPPALAAVLKMVDALGAHPEMMDAVRTVWIRHGVDAAVREVAATGQRGLAVERMLASCAKLRAEQGGLRD